MSRIAQNMIDDDAAEMLNVETARIAPEPGRNPRKYFGPEQEQFNASVAAKGVIQPLVVRPDAERPGSYLLIAGERRWRAATAANLETVPVVVREVDDREAFELAVLENVQRQDMSAPEEAAAARDMLDVCGGDRQEVERQLGWSANKLSARLQLLNCTDAVLKALTERQIKLGHAELLAGLPAETQAGTLRNILDQGITVQELSARVAAFSLDLSAAIFDKAGCQGCAHNSTEQISLFDTAINEGRCTNRACFNEKTEAALGQMKSGLEQDYNLIVTDKERRPDSYTPLKIRGKGGVGPDQAAACKGCGNYGAMMITRPGEEGQVLEGLCFDLSCNRQKADEFAKLFEQPASQAPTAEGGPAVTRSGTAAPGKAAAKGKSNSAAKVTPRKVIELDSAALKRAAAAESEKDPRFGMAIAAARFCTDVRDAGELLKAHGIEDITMVSKQPALVGALMALSTEQLVQLQGDLAARYYRASEDNGETAVPVATATASLGAIQADLTGHFTMDHEYLSARTKSGIESLLTGSGFDVHYDRQHGDGAFKKLMKNKVDALLQAVKDSGFDFTGFIPESLGSRLPSLKK